MESISIHILHVQRTPVLCRAFNNKQTNERSVPVPIFHCAVDSDGIAKSCCGFDVVLGVAEELAAPYGARPVVYPIPDKLLQLCGGRWVAAMSRAWARAAQQHH